MSVEQVIASMERAKAQAGADRAAIDGRWTAEAKKEREAAIDDLLARRIEELRKQGTAEIEEARERARERHYKAQLEIAPKPEQWEEARARAQFVAEDVQRMEPEDVIRTYKAAKAAGDDVGAWLIQREGLRHLAALRDDEARQEGLAARKAIEELEQLAQGKILATHRKELARLAELQVQLVRTAAQAVPHSVAGVVRF